MAKINYFARCLANLAKYGRKSEYVMRYGYFKTLRDIANVQVRSHWLVA